MGDCIDRQLKIYTSGPGAKNAGCWGKLPLEEKLRKLRPFIIAVDVLAAWLYHKHGTVGKGISYCLDCSKAKVRLEEM